MFDLVEEVAKADEIQIEKLLKAVLQRYTVLHPDWEVSTISLQKSCDRNEQLDRIIATLQEMKNFSLHQGNPSAPSAEHWSVTGCRK